MPAQLRGDCLLGASRQTDGAETKPALVLLFPVANVGKCSTHLQENRTENWGNLIENIYAEAMGRHLTKT
jgi:hypothetical protein